MSKVHTTPRGNSIYLGGKKDAKDASFLKDINTTHILNVTPAKETNITAGVPNYFEKKTVSARRITYKRISVYDAPSSDLLQHADDIVRFISTSLHHGSILVHCQRGVSRSATAVMFYLMRKEKMCLEDALDACQRARPCVNPISGFMDQLRKYEQRCIKLGVVNVKKEDESMIVGDKRNYTVNDNDKDGEDESCKRIKVMQGPSLPGPSLPEKPEKEKDCKELDAKKKEGAPVIVGPSLPPNY